ncbi:MAG: hypothetical protein WD830_06435 [Chloroflexota bacterium]
MTDGTHLRPFFPSASDFAAATTPHFQFLVDDFGYAPPTVEESIAGLFEVRYDGGTGAVLLNWDVEGGFIGVHLIPRQKHGELQPDPERWLRPNEILAARGALNRSVNQADLDGVDEHGYAKQMQREAANLREFCADVLRGDWSIFDSAHSWFEKHPLG